MNRGPQVPVTVMRAGVRALVRPVLGPRMPVGVQRRWLRLVTAPTPLAEQAAVERSTLAGRPSETLTPAGGDPGRVVLYLHGGGFTTGCPATHRALATHLAAASGATVHVLDYRLAPEHPFPAALDDVLAGYRELLDRGPAAVAVAGDSAGGWLTLTAALRLRDAGDPPPAALGLLSPWLDLTGSTWPGDRSDAMLRPSWLRRCARDFGGGIAPGSAELAPLDADLAGLPPITMHVGSEEILLEDAVRLAHRARAAGVPVDLRRLDGLWHVAHASAGLVTASTAAVNAMGAALRTRLAAGGSSLAG